MAAPTRAAPKRPRQPGRGRRTPRSQSTTPATLPETLSPRQLGALMIRSGFKRDAGAIATGIGVSTRESGRNSKAKNTAGNSPPSTDRGGWQINDYWHREVTDQCAYDWVCSTKAAARISNGGSDWSQWATYSSDVGSAYRADAEAVVGASDTQLAGWLGDALNSAADQIPGGGLAGEAVGALGDAAGAAGDVISGIPEAIGWLAKAVEGVARFFIGLGELLLTPEGWLRIGKIVFGIALVAFGFNQLFAQTTGRSLGATVGGYLSIGRGGLFAAAGRRA